MSVRTVHFSGAIKKFSTAVAVVALGIVVSSCGSGGKSESTLVKAATTHKGFLVCLLDPTTSARDCYTEFPQHRSRATTAKEAGERIAVAKLARYVADYRIPLSDVEVVSRIIGDSLSLGQSSTAAYRMVRQSDGNISLDGKALANLTDLVLLANYPGAGPREIHPCTARERCYHSGPQPRSTKRSPAVNPG